MNASNPTAGLNYRAVFISDLHLGTRGCRSDFLADFLRRVSCEQLYLVGDIIDGWRLRKSWYWDATHDEVIRLILQHARRGAEVTYIPGNHDEMFRAWLPMGLEVAGIKLRKDAVHSMVDGRCLLVMHGDEFDSVVRYASADVFVFPSLTDTFGLVILEVLACGTPVAAYNVTGPKDVLADADGNIGAVGDDLRAAALAALKGDRAACRAHAERFSWRACAGMFLSHLVPLGGH